MPPPSSKPPPLPLAPDRAAISNKISLLLSNRTSLLKTLNPPSSSSSSQTTQTRRHKVNADDIEQLFSGPRPNEGVGYVPDRKAAAGDAAAREDRMLRGRLLGKKGQRDGKGGKKFAAAVESESDEEPGRSGLGKRKRPRREVEEVEEDGDKVGGEDEVEHKETGHGEGDVEDAAPVLLQQETITDSNGGDDAKRNKKKKKRQREKEKQRQKKLGNIPS
ncbi:hypothetical protein CI102_6041 [Trichoderma harzianum]|uniref:Uncharacterized protein n=1 Tax=Trichoderma harzianum CBS 226.95 TaxID=983964 RepID=A0A2T4AJR1_TRIHA|nr:hypothetical protein M431DRAFT_2436 [Trichoderma harzianum CBS 226.95]PKK48703.1 hypothetical protein CI102_6041 [Trichoderma harzianum]PTB57296.1 hypothetical protein M431DRAFT_2436 [Trichoderma harzianum CBS 226.95]